MDEKDSVEEDSEYSCTKRGKIRVDVTENITLCSGGF